MKPRLYEKGTIKMVWIDEDPGKIYSKMFSDEKKAYQFSRGLKDYLIFSLIEHKDMEEFSWELLPYGRHKIYNTLFRLYRSRMTLFKRLIGNT